MGNGTLLQFWPSLFFSLLCYIYTSLISAHNSATTKPSEPTVFQTKGGASPVLDSFHMLMAAAAEWAVILGPLLMWPCPFTVWLQLLSAHLLSRSPEHPGEHATDWCRLTLTLTTPPHTHTITPPSHYHPIPGSMVAKLWSSAPSIPLSSETTCMWLFLWNISNRKIGPWLQIIVLLLHSWTWTISRCFGCCDQKQKRSHSRESKDDVDFGNKWAFYDYFYSQ